MGRRSRRATSCLILTDGDVVIRWHYSEAPAAGSVVGTVMGPQRVERVVSGPHWEAARREWAISECWWVSQKSDLQRWN